MKEITFVCTDGTAVISPYPPIQPYVAISYRWGYVPSWQFPTLKYTATVSAFYREHFNRLLSWIKRQLGITYVWIDAICINQNNAEDKAKQLGEITRLFHRAEYVIAAPWLAYSLDANVIKVFGEWARRCWVAAEISSAKSIYYTNWADQRMCFSRNDPEQEGFCPPGADPGKMSRDEQEEHRKMSDQVVLLRTVQSFGKFYLDQIAKIALELDATNESDKLYALMPIAGHIVPPKSVQMTLQQCILLFMEKLEPIDRMRLVMGVSRFKQHHRNMSWSFGTGSEYCPPWDKTSFLDNICKASVTLNQDQSLTINARYHVCKLIKGNRTTNSSYYASSYDPTIVGDPSVLFYHPQIDRPNYRVILITCGLDKHNRTVGIMIDHESREKIGIFMLQTNYTSWPKGPIIVR